MREPRELSELKNPLNSTCLCTIRKEEDESKNLLPYIAIAVPPGDTDSFVSRWDLMRIVLFHIPRSCRRWGKSAPPLRFMALHITLI